METLEETLQFSTLKENPGTTTGQHIAFTLKYQHAITKPNEVLEDYS